MTSNVTDVTDTIRGYIDQLREVESNLQQLSLKQQRLIGAIQALQELSSTESQTTEDLEEQDDHDG